MQSLVQALISASRIMLLLLLVLLIPPVLTVNDAGCGDVKNQTSTIEDMLKSIREKSKSRCEDYGTESTAGHKRMEHKFHKLQAFTVCFDAQNSWKKLYVEAQIDAEDLGHGTVVSKRARELLRPYFKECLSDHCGHIVGREFGGAGEFYNLFPQSASLNMGPWSVVNNRLSSHLQLTIDEMVAHYTAKKLGPVTSRTGTIEVAFVYTDSQYFLRPTSFFYKITLAEDAQTIKTIVGVFDNTDHSYANLLLCDVDQQTQIYVVDKSDERYVALQSCDVASNYKALFTPPSPYCPPPKKTKQC